MREGVRHARERDAQAQGGESDDERLGDEGDEVQPEAAVRPTFAAGRPKPVSSIPSLPKISRRTKSPKCSPVRSSTILARTYQAVLE